MPIVLLIILIFLLIKFPTFRGLFLIFLGFSIHVGLLLAAISLTISGLNYGLNALIDFSKYPTELQYVVFVFGLDIGISVASFVDVVAAKITFARRYIKTRFPLLITLMIILFQTKTRNSKFYCPTCQKNLPLKEVVSECIECGTQDKIRFMNITGRVNCQCKGKTDDGRCERTFSRVSPYGKSALTSRQIKCKNCHTPIKTGTVVNLTLFSDDFEMAAAYRETFMSNAFDVEKPGTMGAAFRDEKEFKKIFEHYNGSVWALDTDIPLHPMELQLKTPKLAFNDTMYRFQISIENRNDYRLVPSEGIVLLINGNADSIRKQSFVENFLINLEQINTQSGTWKKPVLVGICANGVKELEDAIDNGFVCAEEAEKYCIEYLEENNNGNMINLLCGKIENMHFFVYRTGNKREKTENKIYNVVHPVLSLMYNEEKKLDSIWKPDERGNCLSVTGNGLSNNN